MNRLEIDMVLYISSTGYIGYKNLDINIHIIPYFR